MRFSPNRIVQRYLLMPPDFGTGRPRLACSRSDLLVAPLRKMFPLALLRLAKTGGQMRQLAFSAAPFGDMSNETPPARRASGDPACRRVFVPRPVFRAGDG